MQSLSAYSLSHVSLIFHKWCTSQTFQFTYKCRPTLRLKRRYSVELDLAQIRDKRAKIIFVVA